MPRPGWEWVEVRPGRQILVQKGTLGRGARHSEKRSEKGSNVKVFGERTYEHLPHDGKRGTPITFTSESALRAHCKRFGVTVGDLL